MPRKRASEASTYDSDDGFVANANDNEDDRPKAKRAKTSQKASAPAKERNGRVGKKDKEVVGGGKIDANGDAFWELSHLRRVTISEFKGKRMVNIREYYEKDGESLPGKKGISMPMDQYASLVALLPHIETVLKEKGETVPRPDYDSVGQGEADGGAEGGGGVEGKGESQGLRGGDGEEVDEKKNFEATSEEDEG